MLADLRYALRQFEKAPGYVATAVLTLALGIGANTAVYSIIHGALRLPYPNSERMVGIQNVFPQGAYYAASYPDFVEWRARASGFSQLVASFPSRATWNGESFGKAQPEAVAMGLASEGFFSMFGMRPIVGRDFLARDHQAGSPPACLVAENFWREKLQADPGVVGRSLDLDGKSCTIEGVMPAFMPEVSRATEIWLPLETTKPWDQHGTNYLFVRGRLRSGVSQSQALADLGAIQSQIDKQFPKNTHGIAVYPLSQAYFGDLRPIMQALLVAVGFILLIACVNLANMLLTRASDRAREFAVRRALGASWQRLVQQTLSESLLLSLGGAAAGLAVAFGLAHIPIRAWPKGFVPPSEVRLDSAVLAFTGALGILAGILFGIVPALGVVRQGDRLSLQPGRTMTESRRHGRSRAALVISEIALSMLLVIGALDVALRFVSLLSNDPGVNPRNAMVMTVMLPAARYPKADDQHHFYRALVDKLSALPGVVAVGGSVDTPFTGSNANGDFQYEGQPEGTSDKNPSAEKHYITPGYFRSLGTPFWQGRDFNYQDDRNAPPVVIINRTMAQKLWPGQSAIGKQLKAGDAWSSIVGVVADIQFARPGEPPAFQIYTPAYQTSLSVLSFVVRLSPNFAGDPITLARPASAVVASIDPKMPVSNVTSLAVLSDEALAGQRTSTTVTAILGALALLLASVGVYGVMAYSVSRREREFAIRIALGANRQGILRLLYASVLRLLLIGMGLGILLDCGARVWIASMLGADGANRGAIVVGGLLLGAAAVIAAAVPAHRATRIFPMEALRNE
jgi:putative ABC transport system permease protein